MFDWQDFIAGYIGGMAGVVVGHPMDTIKVRQQALNTRLIMTIISTYKYEGIRGFFKGMLYPLLSVGPVTSVFFGVYANALHQLQNNPDPHERIVITDPKLYENVFIAGCIGGFVQSFITCPVELIKTILQVRTGSKAKHQWISHHEVEVKRPWSVTKLIVAEQGFLGLFRGMVPTLWRDVIPYGVHVLYYQMYLIYFQELFGGQKRLTEMLAGGLADMTMSLVYMPIYEGFLINTNPKSIPNIIFAGGLTGIISWVIVIPIDVVKSRIQADNPKNPKYKSMMDCVIKSYHEGGARIFMQGTLVIIVRAFPINAATFVAYEMIGDLLTKVCKGLGI